MTGEEVRKLTDAEIKNEIKSLRAQLYQLRTQAVTEKVEDVSRFGKVRKDIARVIHERTNRLKAQQEKKSPKKADTKTTAKAPAAKAATKAPAKKAPAKRAPAAKTAKTEGTPAKAPRKTKSKSDAKA
jgi:ribosomal protein L29